MCTLNGIAVVANNYNTFKYGEFGSLWSWDGFLCSVSWWTCCLTTFTSIAKDGLSSGWKFQQSFMILYLKIVHVIASYMKYDSKGPQGNYGFPKIHSNKQPYNSIYSKYWP